MKTKVLKSFYLFILLTFFFNLQIIAQVHPVSDTQNEIFGYLSFYKLEDTEKGYIRLVAELQDVNLNQIQSSDFIGANYYGIKDVYYNNKYIFFGLQNFYGGLTPDYHIYDLEKNYFSDKERLPMDLKNQVVGFFPIANRGMGYIIKNNDTKELVVQGMDIEENDLFGKKVITEHLEGQKTELEVLLLQEDLLVYKVKMYIRREDRKFKSFVLIINPKTGELIQQIGSSKDKAHCNYINAYVLNNQIVLFGEFYKTNNYVRKGKSNGFVKTTLSSNGDLVETKTKRWTDFSKYLDVNKKGKNKDKMYIYAHDFVLLENQEKVVLIGEHFKPRLATRTFFDFELLEFDYDFNLINSHKIEKGKNVLGVPPIKYSYMGFNYLVDKKGFSLSFRNINKVSITKGIDMTLGTITYFDKSISLSEYESNFGVFSSVESLPRIIKAKPEHFMILTPIKNKNPEIRLERVDY